ncbi:MAG: PAS domain S-box protein [Desulfotignum sp.]|nr:PAS domain S-box protein [Desulfobacteraceae bacterium]
MAEKPTYEELERRIQELEKAESERNLAEERLKKIFDNTQDAIFIHDLEGNILDVNDKMCRMYGLTKEEALEVTIEDLSSSNMPMKDLLERWPKVLNGEKLLFEWEACRPKDESVFNVEVSIQKISFHDKNIVLANVRDITARKRTEKSLEESEERFRTLMENIDAVAVQSYGPDGTTQYWNAASEKLYGYSRQEAIGRNLLDLIIPSEMKGAVVKEMREMAESGRYIPSGEMVLMHKNGSRVPVISHHAIVKVPEREQELFCLDVDITERKQAEAEKEKLQAQLNQTQKMESIGSLAGGIAHDFNNILFPILGNCQLILDDFEPGSPEHESLKAIMNAGERGKALVQQILAIGRQSGQQPIPVQIQMVLKEVLKLIRSTTPANVHITKDIQKDCGAVHADPTQIHQITMNLITNASHALEDDLGEIAVRLKEVELEAEDFISENLEPGRYAMLTVSDTGSGISPDIMDKLFDPYFTTKEQGKGTGLGLSVVHGIVKSYGGEIKVYSELGKGTSFHVYLPVIHKAAEIEETRENRPLPTGNERILVVDDEAPIIRLEETLLTKLGYKVTSRTGSIDALEKFKMDPFKFDLVLTDMSMPNMTGEKLAMELISIRPDIPVILCTGFSERIDKEKAEALGIKGFLMKPVVNRDIAQTIRKVLDEAKS